MAGEVEVRTEAMRQHAEAVDRVGAGVMQAADAGGTATGFTPVAFGILCSFFTAPATAVSLGATASIVPQGLACSVLAGGVRASATAYDVADSEFAQRLVEIAQQGGI